MFRCGKFYFMAWISVYGFLKARNPEFCFVSEVIVLLCICILYSVYDLLTMYSSMFLLYLTVIFVSCESREGR